MTSFSTNEVLVSPIAFPPLNDNKVNSTRLADSDRAVFANETNRDIGFDRRNKKNKGQQ